MIHKNPSHNLPNPNHELIESAKNLYNIVSHVISSQEIGPGYSLTIGAYPDEDGPLFLTGSPLKQLESVLDKDVYIPKQNEKPWIISYGFDAHNGGVHVDEISIPAEINDTATRLSLQRTQIGFIPMVQQDSGESVPYATEAQQLEQRVFERSHTSIIDSNLVNNLIARAQLPRADKLRDSHAIAATLDAHPDWQRTEAFASYATAERSIQLKRQTQLGIGGVSEDTFVLQIQESDNPQTYRELLVEFTTHDGYFMNLPTITESEYNIPTRELFPLDEPTLISSRAIPAATADMLDEISCALLDDLGDVA